MKYDFDVVVIGGGAGGLFAASVANALGARTCLIEKKRLGGDCTWFGCMPSKAILKSAQVAHLFKRASEFGIKVGGEISFDTNNVLSHIRDVIQEISTHHPAEVFEKRGVKVIFGSPQFIDENSIELIGERIISKKFIICTGSHPIVPPIEGLKNINYLTNENIFELEKLPASLIVLGGGPIGVELSQALNRLGVKIYIVEMLERILFREDKEAAKVLEDKLINEGVKILTGKKAVKFDNKAGLVYVTLEDKDKNQEQIFAENVLVAVGRAPNIEGLSLEQAGVEYNKSGIKVNAHLQTTNNNIFACGDVVGPYMFSHVAAYQAQICVRNTLFKRLAWQKVNYQNIAWATFTEPELSHLGWTEEEAREKYKDINPVRKFICSILCKLNLMDENFLSNGVKVYKTEYASSDRAITDSKKEGLVKVITDKKGNILGAHIVGALGSEVIQGFLIAKSLKIPLERLSGPLFVYPTLSELIKKTAAKPLIDKLNNPLVKLAMRIFRR